MLAKFWFGSLKMTDHSEDLGLHGRIKMDLKEIGREGVDWIRLALDTER
jgi:hypothetical protein